MQACSHVLLFLSLVHFKLVVGFMLRLNRNPESVLSDQMSTTAVVMLNKI